MSYCMEKLSYYTVRLIKLAFEEIILTLESLKNYFGDRLQVSV